MIPDNTQAAPELKRLTIMGRYYVYTPRTARHAELDYRTWLRVGKLMQEKHGDIRSMADVPGMADLFKTLPVTSGNRQVPSLRSLILQVSHACNLRCRYCSADFGRYGGGFREMSPATAQKAMDFLFDAGPSAELAVTYFGGEPLLNLNTVLSSARYARDRAAKEGRILSLHLVTNGVLLTPQTLFRLDEMDFSLTVSLDGEPACHDQCRPFPDGRGSHDVICRFLEVAGNLPIGQRITVRGTFTRQNAGFFPSVRFLIDNGFSRNMAFEPVFLPASHPLALHWRDLPAVKHAYDELARYYVRRWQQGEPFCLWDFDDAITQVAGARPRPSRCGAGVTTLAVTAEEDLYACHMSTGMPDAKLGNLREGIMEDSSRPWQEKYLTGRPGCSGCWLQALCGGGCNTHALFYNRSLCRPYRLECELIAHRYRLAFWMLSELPGLKEALVAPSGEKAESTGHLLESPLWTFHDAFKP